MKKLVRLWKRPTHDGSGFRFYLLYTDEHGKRRQKALGHCDRRKAERQRARMERDIRVGAVEPESMSLRAFASDCLGRTGEQIRESTRREYKSAMEDFIKVVGNCDYQKVTLEHGELYRQACLDRGNTPGTVSKKLRHLRRLFQLGLIRRQLDENPFAFIDKPRSPKRKVNVYSNTDCERMVKAAWEYRQDWNSRTNVKWDLLIIVALATAMRRGELLNCTWDDIDFEKQTIEVSPKSNTDETWEWQIKDQERRTLPLTSEIVHLLANHQSEQPDGYPYVFVPTARYEFIQEILRPSRKWTLSDSRLKVVNNFSPKFKRILQRAHVKDGEFHDLRKTALSNWFANGMSEYDVMTLAGHASFSTTHRFYLAVADDLVDRARRATAQSLSQKLLQICCKGISEVRSRTSSNCNLLPAGEL